MAVTQVHNSTSGCGSGSGSDSEHYPVTVAQTVANAPTVAGGAAGRASVLALLTRGPQVIAIVPQASSASPAG
eukprot:11038841-Prorocentrum_lima.AAC.1